MGCGYVLTVCSSEIDHYFYICILNDCDDVGSSFVNFCSSQIYNYFYMCFYMQFLG